MEMRLLRLGGEPGRRSLKMDSTIAARKSQTEYDVAIMVSFICIEDVL